MTSDLQDWAKRWNLPAAALSELHRLTVDAAALDHDHDQLEAPVQRDIRLALQAIGVPTWRNNSGAAVLPPARPGGQKRFIRFGLGNETAALNKEMKSSDLIGLIPYVLPTAAPYGLAQGFKQFCATPAQLSKNPGGWFLAIEVKRSSWAWRGTEAEIAQYNYIRFVVDRGGCAFFATSPTHAVEEVRRFIYEKSTT